MVLAFGFLGLVKELSAGLQAGDLSEMVWMAAGEFRCETISVPTQILNFTSHIILRGWISPSRRRQQDIEFLLFLLFILLFPTLSAL